MEIREARYTVGNLYLTAKTVATFVPEIHYTNIIKNIQQTIINHSFVIFFL